MSFEDKHNWIHHQECPSKDGKPCVCLPRHKDSFTIKARADEEQIGGDHYKTMAIQPSHYIYQNELNWYEGNAVKYITRHRVKGGRKDIEKAIHYLRLLLEEEYDVD